MSVRIGVVVVGVEDVPRAVSFWTAALGYVPRPGGEDDWTQVMPASGEGGPELALMLSESATEARPRLHLDLFVYSAAEQHAEVERLLELGASHVDWPLYPPEPDFVVLADPDGNLFCVVDKSRGHGGGSPGGRLSG